MKTRLISKFNSLYLLPISSFSGSCVLVSCPFYSTMKALLGASFTLVVLVAIVAFYLYKQFLNSEMDFANYVLSKGSKFFVTDLYPKNNTIDLVTTRRNFNDLGVNIPAAKWGGMLTRINIPRTIQSDREKQREKDAVIRKDLQPHRPTSTIPLRVYYPIKTENVSDHDPLPVIIWFHGGGWVIGSAAGDDHKCYLLSKLTGFVLVSVDYRLAPEFMYPAALDDAASALSWVHSEISHYGGDPNTIILAGEDAGGNLAAALASLNLDNRLTLRPKPHRQDIKLSGLLLIYPPLQYETFRPSHFKYRDTNGLLTLDQQLWFWKLYLGDLMANAKQGCRDYSVCPLNTPNKVIQRFPQTAILLAKHDVLLDEGLAFESLLLKNNVPVESLVLTDAVHGSWANFDYTEAYKKSNVFIQEQLMAMANWKKVIVRGENTRLLISGDAEEEHLYKLPK